MTKDINTHMIYMIYFCVQQLIEKCAEQTYELCFGTKSLSRTLRTVSVHAFLRFSLFGNAWKLKSMFLFVDLHITQYFRPIFARHTQQLVERTTNTD